MTKVSVVGYADQLLLASKEFFGVSQAAYEENYRRILELTNANLDITEQMVRAAADCLMEHLGDLVPPDWAVQELIARDVLEVGFLAKRTGT